MHSTYALKGDFKLKAKFADTKWPKALAFLVFTWLNDQKKIL